MVEERHAGGRFTSIFDLTERVDPKSLNRTTLEALIKAGALDSLGPNREQHMLAVERATQAAAALHRDRKRGQKNLFGDEETASGTAEELSLPDATDWTRSRKLAAEKEVFGFYLTSHPLTERAAELGRFATQTTADLTQLEDRDEVLLAGMISSIKKATTKKPSRNGNSRYVNFDFEDPHGIVRCIMWPEQFAQQGNLVQPELICFVKGRIDRRGREPNVIVDRLLTLEDAEKEFTSLVAIKFQKGLHTAEDMTRVRDILNRFPGKTEVHIIVDSADENAPNQRVRYILYPPSALRVSCGPHFREELEQALGNDHFRFHAAQKRTNGTQRHHQPA